MSYHWRKAGLAGSVGSIDLRRWEQQGRDRGAGVEGGEEEGFL